MYQSNTMVFWPCTWVVPWYFYKYKGNTMFFSLIPGQYYGILDMYHSNIVGFGHVPR